MELFHVLSCLCLGPLLALGSPPEYDLTHLCGGGGPVTVFTSAVLKADGMWLRSGESCTVQVSSSFHSDVDSDKLRLELLSLDIPCGKGYMRLFDGDERDGDVLSDNICGDISFQQKMFLSSKKDFITVTLHSYRDLPVSLRLLATATSKQYESNDFICDNFWDVSNSLQCDGDNNCGDWSDENSYLCPEDLLSWHWDEILIIACSWIAFLVFVGVVVLWIKRRRRRRRQLYEDGAGRPITTGQEQTTPVYGSINPTTFLPSPPPYTPPLTSAATTGQPPPPYSPHPPPPCRG